MTESHVNRAKWQRVGQDAPARAGSGHDLLTYHDARVRLLARTSERAERMAAVAAAVGGAIFLHYALRQPDPLLAPLVAAPVVCGYFFLRLYRAKDAEAKNLQKLHQLYRQRDDKRP